MLGRHVEDYKTEALSDDLKKEALMESIPEFLGQMVKDSFFYRGILEDTSSYDQYNNSITARIARDALGHATPMVVDQVAFKQTGQQE